MILTFNPSTPILTLDINWTPRHTYFSIPLFTGDWKGFMSNIKHILTSKVPTPHRSEFLFELSQKAAIHNSNLLEKYEFDMAKAIKANPNSIISPGSELRPIDQLSSILAHHPYFPLLKESLQTGIDYPAEDLPEETRVEELHAQLARGNHKSALTKEALPIVDKLVHQDANLGYAISITKDCMKKIKGGELYPLGLQHQLTIDENGKQMPKKRVTHDLSNRKKLGLSINQRVDEEKVPETKYGHAILRFLHLIHHIRYQHPTSRILMAKSDFDKAYRRLHTHPRIAAKCMAAWTTIESDKNETEKRKFIGTLLTRLPFGSSPAPSTFSLCSETIFDLANDLLLCPFWNPDELPSPHIDMIPEPERFDDEIPYEKALEADVHLPPSQKGGVEGYIDDGAIAVLDEEENKRMVNRARQALPMATHLVFRPHAGQDEPIQRPDPQSIRKLEAEGRLREIIILLGWEIDSRALSIALPPDKVIAWKQCISDILKKTSISWDDAKTLVGRLNHVGFIIPSARHFLNRIRRLEYIADKHGRAKVNRETSADLALWLKFLDRARKGMSINSIIYRVPTTITLSDACEFGMGGYNLKTGLAWRYEFTKDERETFSLNLKEFIASVINTKLNLPLDQSKFPCILSIGDSNCAAGWMHKSNFDPTTDSIHAEVARENARTIMQYEACEYSQHIPGITNVIADCLSRDFHLSNKKLTSLLYSVKPPYLPATLKITPLDPTVVSWIGSLVQNQPRRKELPQKHSVSTLAAGVSGWNSSQNAASTTPTWKNPNLPKEYGYSKLSCTQFVVDSIIHSPDKFQGPLRERPLDTWQRPLLQVVGLTQRKTLKEKRS